MGGEIAVAADVPLNSLLLIIKWVLSKLSGSVWNGFIRLRTGTDGRLL
jgi:hypothetical protein